jgi:hypothetical protein
VGQASACAGLKPRRRKEDSVRVIHAKPAKTAKIIDPFLRDLGVMAYQWITHLISRLQNQRKVGQASACAGLKPRSRKEDSVRVVHAKPAKIAKIIDPFLRDLGVFARESITQTHPRKPSPDHRSRHISKTQKLRHWRDLREPLREAVHHA